MNYSKIRRKLRKIKNTIIRILVAINLISLVFWMCLVDAIISWQPVAIMLVNFSFLMLVAYANGHIVDTKRYYERIEKEGEW